MTHYAGLDVSMRETAICIVNDTGATVWERKVATDPETIARALRTHAPKLARAGMETGPSAVWL